MLIRKTVGKAVQVNLNGISSLELSFRGRMNETNESADVDEVRILAQ